MRSLTVTAPILLCVIGIALSFEYRGEQHKIPLWVCRGLSIAIAAAGALGLLVAYPHNAILALGIAAVLVNLPLAALGIKKNKK